MYIFQWYCFYLLFNKKDKKNVETINWYLIKSLTGWWDFLCFMLFSLSAGHYWARGNHHAWQNTSELQVFLGSVTSSRLNNKSKNKDIVSSFYTFVEPNVNIFTVPIIN